MTRRDDSRRAADRKRQAANPWRSWYGTKDWKIRRARQLKADAYLCQPCKRAGRSRVATTVDHVVPHRGDRNLFLFGKVESMCASCHSAAKQLEEIEGFSREIGDDGFPTDPRHPFNRR